MNLLDDLMPRVHQLLCSWPENGASAEKTAEKKGAKLNPTQNDVSSTDAVFPPNTGAQRIILPLKRQEMGKLLDWLAAQTLFPKFYWLHRDGSEEVAALGQVRNFTRPDAASAFVRQQESAFRLWGGTAFDGEQARSHGCLSGWFFLPRFELSQGTKGAQLVINLFSQTSLRADAALAWQQFSTLVSGTALTLPDVTVINAQHLPEHGAWCDLVNRALSAIDTHQVDKVVLARKTTLTLDTPVAAPQLLNASRRVNHRCFHFMLAMDDKHGFVGSSPERLFRRHGLALHTEALAGTVSRTGDDKRDAQLANWLLSDKKNQHENLLVVEDICTRLNGHVDNVDVLSAEVLALRKVQHLRRKITAQLRTRDDAECLEWLHPTAAVAGLPREPARAFIHEHEPFERGWYAGSVGYLSRDRAEFTVAIRSALIQQHYVHLFAGAGIVPGSDPEAEWQEIERKAAGLRTLLEPDYVNECL
ncbi:MAG: isochorismate synthase [Plesiomonas sp.]